MSMKPVASKIIHKTLARQYKDRTQKRCMVCCIVRGNETTICIIATAYKKLITGLLGKNIT